MNLEKGKRKNWFKQRWYVIAAGIFVLAGAFAYYYLKSSVPIVSASTTPAFYTTTVHSGDIRVSAVGSGTLTASNQVSLSFSTSGIVGKLNVSVGDKVKAGDILASLADVDSLEANVASSELALIQAQQTLDALHNNAQVNLATAYQSWVTAKTTYEDALSTSQRTDYARCSEEVNKQNTQKYQKALDKLNSLSKYYGTQDWINAKNDYDTAYANWTYCQAYTKDEVTSAKATVDVDKLKMNQAETLYNLLKNNNGIEPSDLAIAEAKVKEAQSQLAVDKKALAGATLIAPIDGTIISIAASQGEMVSFNSSTTSTTSASSYITLADLTHPDVAVQLDEADMDKMVVGNQAEVVFDALPDNTYTGKLTQANPALVTSGQYTVVKGILALDQAPTSNDQSVPLGLTAKVTVITGEAKNVLLVPLDALRDLGSGQYGVFVVNKNQKLSFRTVEVGLKNAAYAEIKSGLKEGEIVSTGAVKTSK